MPFARYGPRLVLTRCPVPQPPLARRSEPYLVPSLIFSPAFSTSLPKPWAVLQAAQMPTRITVTEIRMRMRLKLPGIGLICLLVSKGHPRDSRNDPRHGGE